MCITCAPNHQNVTACIVIIYTTYNIKVLQQQLQVYSINKSNSKCLITAEEQDFNIAVFGLYGNTLERIPVYANVVKSTARFTTSGKMFLYFVVIT